MGTTDTSVKLSVSFPTKLSNKSIIKESVTLCNKFTGLLNNPFNNFLSSSTMSVSDMIPLTYIIQVPSSISLSSGRYLLFSPKNIFFIINGIQFGQCRGKVGINMSDKHFKIDFEFNLCLIS